MPSHRSSDRTRSPHIPSSRPSSSQSRSKKARFHFNSEDAMDAVNIPTERIPEDLKVCEQILKRGKEVKKVEPVVAYWCCFSAAHKIMDVRNRSKEGTAFLMSLLDALEEMKGILADNDAVTNEAAGAAYVQNFALKVFMGGDNDDRNGITGKATVRKFVVAGQFIEVLRCFENGMTEEMEQKLQYARWKAADGAKALRERREPTSGPPIPDEPLLPELPSGSPGQSSQFLSGSPAHNTPTSQPSHLSSTATPVISPRPSPAQQARANLPGLDVSDSRTPGRTNSTASGAWSTVATPGLAEDDDGEKRFDLPAVPNASLADEAKSPHSGEKRNVRFMGPDGAPLSPAQTHLSVESYDAPDAPPPTTFGDSPTSPKPSAPAMSKGDSSSSSRSNGSTPASSSNRARGVSNASHHSLPSGSRSTPTGTARPSPSLNPTIVPPPPPPSLASYPSVPPSTAQPNGLGLTSPPPSAPPFSSLPGPAHANNPTTAYHNNPIPKLTRKQVEQTQKHARWAVSALEFDDAETARSELRKALAILGG